MNAFYENSFQSRADLENAAKGIIRALLSKRSAGGGGFDLGPHRGFYGEGATRLETFSRMLWAAGPLCVHGHLNPELISSFIAEGTDPDSPGYWGRPGLSDSRFVEMTAIAFALKISPQVGELLDVKAKARLVDWLGSINSGEIARNNWRYFRIFVNEVLGSLGGDPDHRQVETDLEVIESLYMGNGWYSDGESGTIDYYNSFAFHYYGLLYAFWAKDRDSERARLFRERACQFANTFIYWWDSDGSSIPYGRSLIYRFGMAAFWAAAAYTELPIFDNGTLRGLLLRCFRWWSRRDIFTTDGILSLGFAYPNHNMLEMYNAAGSPMWALKAFLPLALPPEHPFWLAEELPFPDLNERAVLLPDGQKILGRSKTGHAWMLSAGCEIPWHGRAFFDKYSRFAYSSVFGFSVSLEDTTSTAMAPDSTLIISENGRQWFGRREAEEYRSGADWVESTWSPCPGVRIVTRLTITPSGHRRWHRVATEREIEVIEGGFALPRPEEILQQMGKNPVEGFSSEFKMGSAMIQTGSFYSSIVDIGEGCDRSGSGLQPWANTHLLFPATIIPVLSCKLTPGSHVLECEVAADRRNQS
jgi:hypothetical protein